MNQITQNNETHIVLERSVEEVEKIIAYKFKNPNLLERAFTHSSFEENCASYERLEFMGDAALNLLIATEHFLNYPDLPPGKLTRLRATNVDTEKLARVAIKYNLHDYLRHNKPLLKGQVEEFRDAIMEYPLHSTGLVDAPKVLADIVESLIGAIYIDGNFSMNIIWQVVKNLLQPLITPEKLEIHPVTKIIELCQKNGLKVKFVDSWEETGEVEVHVDGKLVGKGKFNGKKLVAINRAAHNGYLQVVKNLSVKKTTHDYPCDENLVSLYTSSSEMNQITLNDETHIVPERSVEEVEKIIAYKFKNPNLLQQAFTHSSFEENCASYERLEYVGDAVLNLLIATAHYLDYPDLPPGKLTRLRAANVDTEKLARVAIKYNLHDYLRHKKPLLKGQVEGFRNAIMEYPLHSTGLIDPPKVLADIVESLIGAIYIDCNFSMDTTWKVVKNFLRPLITLEKLEIHPVTKINELCQKNGLKVEFVDSWGETGEVEVHVNGKIVGKGKFSGKKIIAQNRAAHNAYYQVVTNLSKEKTTDDYPCDETQS
ncbi:endoribonuclease Dicer homolog 1-like isoform X1 [Nicotiana sylvestris]